MKNLMKPFGLIGAGVLLGMGLFFGANIGRALIQITASGSSGPQPRRKQ